MDLKDLTPKEDTVEVTLKHPGNGEVLNNEDGTPMTISFYLPHTKEAKKVQHELTNKRLKAMSQKKQMDVTAEDLEEISLDSLVKTTHDWNITYGGEKPKFSVKKAREVYEEVFWIRSQVEGAIADAMDFTKL